MCHISEESFEKKLVGFAADGAAVNRGEKDGVDWHSQRL